MIYEYPEEFIIPVIYVDDLKGKSSYRQEDCEELRDWKLLILEDEDSFPLIYKEAMVNDNTVEESLEDENKKKILSDIDNEYANSETVHAHS